MTIIVGIPHNGRVYLGADSMLEGGGLIRTGTCYCKLWTHGSMVFGLTGSPREQQVLQYATEIAEPPRGDALLPYLCTTVVTALRAARKDAGYDERSDRGTESGPCGLIGVHGRLFTIFSDYQIMEFETACAIGSGEDVALGSLHTSAQYAIGVRQRLMLALQAACDHTPYCGPPFAFVTSSRA